MTDRRSLDDLKGQPAPAPLASLYHRAFQEYGAAVLWSRRPSEKPTIAQVLVVAESLRRESSMQSRPLAAEIEAACRAALTPAPAGSA